MSRARSVRCRQFLRCDDLLLMSDGLRAPFRRSTTIYVACSLTRAGSALLTGQRFMIAWRRCRTPVQLRIASVTRKLSQRGDGCHENELSSPDSSACCSQRGCGVWLDPSRRPDVPSVTATWPDRLPYNRSSWTPGVASLLQRRGLSGGCHRRITSQADSDGMTCETVALLARACTNPQAPPKLIGVRQHVGVLALGLGTTEPPLAVVDHR